MFFKRHILFLSSSVFEPATFLRRSIGPRCRYFILFNCDPLDHDAIIPFTYKKQCTPGLDSKNRIDKDATKFYQLWSGLKESLKGGGECDDAEEDKLLAGHGVSTLNPADKNGQESRQKAQ